MKKDRPARYALQLKKLGLTANCNMQKVYSELLRSWVIPSDGEVEDIFGVSPPLPHTLPSPHIPQPHSTVQTACEHQWIST